MGEGGRIVCPRIAWKTPPGYESLKGASGDSSGSLALAQACSQGARTSAEPGKHCSEISKA